MSLRSYDFSSIYGNHRRSNPQEINESILNHLFLPLELSCSANNDYLIQSNHQDEHKILECMLEYLQSLNINNELSIFSTLKTCTERWSAIQNVKNCSVSLLQSTIRMLSPGDFLPLYFHAQNATILIEIDQDSPYQPLISSWQVLLPTETITSSLEPHFSCFPVHIYRLPDRSQLSSSVQCELLLEFMNNTIEYSKSIKSSHVLDETREVPIAHYVCHWWITQFQGVQIDNKANTSVSFKKKHRDQIRYKSSDYPFRRSGLWMTMKVVFQHILTKHLGTMGTIIYKLLITDFLTYFISTRQNLIKFSLSTELLVHCLRKIARRLNKIEVLSSSIDSSNVYPWIQNKREEIKQKIDQLIPNLDWQKPIEINQKQSIPKISLISTQQEIYKHRCKKLTTYLGKDHNSTLKRSIYDRYSYDNWRSTSVVHNDNGLPRVSVLTNHESDDTGIALIRIEIWVQSCLEEWINRSTLSATGYKCFENLQSFYEDYQREALDFYYSNNQSTDPIGYSRFILTSLTIIRLMHMKLCADPQYERLKLHAILIPHLLELFEYLILPTRQDMIRARDLYDYFLEFKEKYFPELLNTIDSSHSFGVAFAAQSVEINENLQKLEEQIKQDQENKIEEINQTKEKYEELMKKVIELKCECETIPYRYEKCSRCKMIKEAENMKVHIYERPIPSERKCALAVMFELQMPNEIRCYRDILWQFINRPKPNPTISMYEWLSTRPHQSKLRQYFKGSYNCKVKLVSSTKSISESHYSAPRHVISTPLEEFFYDSSLKVQISPTKVNELKNECRTLTPNLTDSHYQDLQFSIDSTEFVQNRVIAELSKCSLKLKIAEFIEFGSFRSGHCLQWWNLLSILELDSLSMDEESVVILIAHALLQYGPMTINRESLISSWCPESHQQLLDDHFVDELIVRLDRHLKDCESNWQNELILVILVTIVMRVYSVCNSTRKDQMSNLVFKCRKTGEKWIELISKTMQNASSSESNIMSGLRDKIIIVGICCLLTYSIYIDTNNTCLILTNDDIISLLTISTTIHDNTILNNNKTAHMSVCMRNLMRYSEYVLVSIQPIINKLFEENSYESLNKFCAIHWAVIRTKGGMNGKWKKRNQDLHDGWYDGEYQSNKLSIDCIKGRFFVNKMTVGFLPPKIRSDELFRRVFGEHIFEVQSAESENSYITKYGYHTDGQVFYEFTSDNEFYSNQCLVVYERHLQTNEKFQLIPHNCFATELPDIFVSNYSHWWNAEKNILQFRPIHFQEPDFLNNISYILELKNGLIKTCNTEHQQYLVNRSSSFFHNLFQQYFIRLDDEPYVYMLRENDVIHIHLSRLGIAFKYHSDNNLIISREYSDMYINEEQCFGTLTGLKSGLLLSPVTAMNAKHKQGLGQKLIVPFGQVEAIKESNQNHQTVTIKRESSSTLSIHVYFVFILNNRLRILQPTDSPTGWLYLALLHAMTSHPLPDRYTGMTGMERSFQLLNSAGCWSDQPYDAITRNILLQIATISPKVNFYPENLTCMVQIHWNPKSLPYSMQHFGYYLIAKKLIETSEEWNFMYSSTNSNDELDKLLKNKKYNERLLGKLYWDYRDSYNPTARLSTQMENDIRSTHVTKVYQPIWKDYSHSMNFSALRLVDSLYSSGDVNLKDSSELRCFPLSRWLKSEYELKHIWIGLFKCIEQLKTFKTDDSKDIERFEILLDFLYYISSQCSSQPIYLEILRSILKSPIKTLRSIAYPPFTHYEHIEETSYRSHRIHIPSLGYCKRNIALAEIQNCFAKNIRYTNEDLPRVTQINNEIYRINRILESWRENAKFRSFVEDVQNHIRSVPLFPWNVIVTVKSQNFSFELFQNHFQLYFHRTDECIDKKLFENAYKKFFCCHSNYFIEPNTCVPIINEQKEFPQEIFPSIDSQVNPLSDITRFFKENLIESWKKFNSVEEYRKEFPTVDEINRFLDSFCQESSQLWYELVKSITTKNDLVIKVGLVLRIIPTTLISVLQQIWLAGNQTDESPLPLTFEQRTLLGGIMVNWIVEQQIERALNLANQNKWEDFEKEISNVPHTNWIPAKHLAWLILQLEMNITIREIQVQVARHMIEPISNDSNPSVRNIVMQMNMGEGKTSVILPMLALNLCSSSSSLVRIIVLRALFSMNYQSLRYKLGGLLNRCVIPFSCCRDMNFTSEQVNKIFNRFKQGLSNLDIVLTSPEDILSFDLLTIDKCRRNEFETGRSMLSLHSWIKTFVRDVLDESDEILHVKYQLIYSIGRQQQVDGGVERWQTIQYVLNLVKKHAPNIAQEYQDDVLYKASERQSSFPEFRLLNPRPFAELCRRIAMDWMNQKSYRQLDQQLILSFLLNTNISIDSVVNQFPYNTIQSLLIIRGLLSSEVLLVGLKKRYRVNYGVNENAKFNRLMAVPFRAKDVAAENTEFGHPDVAIVLTQMSYYYKGLTDLQLYQCFNRLNQDESDPEMIYDQWIALEGENNLIASIKNWKRVNVKDHQQQTQLIFPTFRYNILVINYFLNHFVFPREAKQFPYKLVASAWDLSSSLRQKILTGFSGTNDTQLLLPVHIQQYDLPELRKTDAIVLNNLLRSENDRYQYLPISTSSDEILRQIVSSKPMIQVILDVGALFIDGTNRQIATKWLDLSRRDQIDYSVYFESNRIFVCDRQYQHHAFLTSPASERLDRCVFYLDEIHTRGTDFKFPNDFRAAVTLGNGLTKDRLVQACMRMRKLGTHHWLSFWSSNEVHQQIQTMKKNSIIPDEKKKIDERIMLTDILRWVYENTQQATWDGLHLWATQSLNFQRKMTAFRNISWKDKKAVYTNAIMDSMAKECLESEVLELKSMYGPSKGFETILDIYVARYKYSRGFTLVEIHEAISKRLRDYSGSKKLLTQLLDEEQQRELEREQELEEERQQKRPLAVHPAKHQLHEEIKALCDMHNPILELSKLNSVFSPIANAFFGTTLYPECQPQCWQENFWVTDEFKRVIETHGELLDPFLRPPRWVLIYRNVHIIFVSPFEANWLMGQLDKLYRKQLPGKLFTTTLRLLLPRTRRDQSIIVNTNTLTIPPSITVPDRGALMFSIPTEWLPTLFIFNGTLYFETVDEQTAYCQNLGICPKPRTKTEEEAFEKGWISIDGFVSKSDHRDVLQIIQCRFIVNPLPFIRKLVENRNNIHAPLISHVGSILINGVKLFV